MSRLVHRSFAFSTLSLAVATAAACGSDKEEGTGSTGPTGTTATNAAGPTNGTATTGPGATNTNGATTASTSSANSSTTSTTGVGGATSTGATITGATSTGGGTSSSTGGATGATTATSTTGSAGGGNNPIAGTDSYDCSAPEGDVPALSLTQVVGGLTAPVDLTHPPNDPRLFVITLDGDVRIIKDGALVDAPFLSIGSKVTVGGPPGDERGLLGIAFHPDYAQNGLFYLHYSAGQGVAGTSAGDTVIEEYQVSSDPDVADPNSARVVLTVDQPSNNHNGGSISFGSDGLLYIGLGDGGGFGDMQGNAQNTSALLGKILRIDPVESGGQPYSTPADNLPGGAPEVWDYGLRNPFRSSFDACTGDLYIGDVGQDTWEEITIEKAGEGHKNYGWNVMEALHCYPANTQTCDDTGMTEPMVEVDRQSAQSITGGSVYRGAGIPGLRGIYFYADYQANAVWYLRYDRDAHSVDTPRSVAQELNASRIVAIKNGSDGELYFVSLGTITGGNLGQGAVYRLTAAP